MSLANYHVAATTNTFVLYIPPAGGVLTAMQFLKLAICPTEASQAPQSGALVVWDIAAPLGWDFEKYYCGANGNRISEARLAKPLTIRCRANRAAIFDSSLFHKSHNIVFKQGI
jgi:hypothetical protein